MKTLAKLLMEVFQVFQMEHFSIGTFLHACSMSKIDIRKGSNAAGVFS